MWNTRRAAPHRFQTVTLAWFEGRCRAPSPNSATVCNHHSFLADPDADEKRLSAALAKTANSLYDS